MTQHIKQLRNRIAGPVYSIVTPFCPKTDEIDYEALENYLQLIYDASGRIFYVMAYNSRYSQLTFDEINQLNFFVTKKVKELNLENIVIVGDPPHCSTSTSIEFAQSAEACGADLISLIVRERYYGEDQIFEHYKQISECSQIGLLIHEMPFLSGLGGPPVNWPLSLLDRIADIPSVVAIKEDAKDDVYSKQVLEKLSSRLTVIMSGGGKRQWLRFSNQGCQAWLNGIGVFEPRLAATFWKSWQAGNQRLCDEIIEKIEEPFFTQCVSKFGWHLAIKAALEARGIMSRHDRMPLMPLSQEQADEVYRVMDELPIEALIS